MILDSGLIELVFLHSGQQLHNPRNDRLGRHITEAGDARAEKISIGVRSTDDVKTIIKQLETDRQRRETRAGRQTVKRQSLAERLLSSKAMGWTPPHLTGIAMCQTECVNISVTVRRSPR